MFHLKLLFKTMHYRNRKIQLKQTLFSLLQGIFQEILLKSLQILQYLLYYLRNFLNDQYFIGINLQMYLQITLHECFIRHRYSHIFHANSIMNIELLKFPGISKYFPVIYHIRIFQRVYFFWLNQKEFTKNRNNN